MPSDTAPWQAKAHRLIATMCTASYRQANQKADGTLYTRHRPYAVPALAEALIHCLNTEDEAGAKAIFVEYGTIAEDYKR